MPAPPDQIFHSGDPARVSMPGRIRIGFAAFKR